MTKRGKLAPLRTALHFEEAARQFVLDPVLGLVEPPMAAVMELQKLRGFAKAGLRMLSGQCSTSLKHGMPCSPIATTRGVHSN